MKIKHLCIENFRGIRKFDLGDLDPHINLFVGVNGAGKSSVLDAISLLMSWYISRIQNSKGRGRDIPVEDILIGSTSGCTIELTLDDNSKWKLYRTTKYTKTTKSDLTDLNRLVSLLREQVDTNSDVSLPIVAYYGVNRVIPNTYPHSPRGKQKESVLDTYTNALKTGQLFSDFYKWFKLSEDYENEIYRETGKEYVDRGLSAVREAMTSVFPEYSQMKVGRRPSALYLVKGENKLKINQLSDGEKCYITLVCDLARRLSVANPIENPLEGKGIVLIDEVDLHLHPLWQQTVITQLTKTFKNVQFFITSHSPIVASDVDGAVFVIKDGEIDRQKTYGKLSSNILSSVFDVSMARNLYVQSLFEKAYEALSCNNRLVYQEMYEAIVSILGPDDIDVIGLRIEDARRKIGRRG